MAGQNQIFAGRKAALYIIGLFITISTIGFICAVLDRMPGNVSPYMGIVVGVILVWVSLDTLG